MFRASFAGGEGEHSYVVIPASPVFRLRLQKEAGGDGGAWCKVEAFFNEVNNYICTQITVRLVRRQIVTLACGWFEAKKFKGRAV